MMSISSGDASRHQSGFDLPTTLFGIHITASFDEWTHSNITTTTTHNALSLSLRSNTLYSKNQEKRDASPATSLDYCVVVCSKSSSERERKRERVSVKASGILILFSVYTGIFVGAAAKMVKLC